MRPRASADLDAQLVAYIQDTAGKFGRNHRHTRLFVPIGAWAQGLPEDLVRRAADGADCDARWQRAAAESGLVLRPLEHWPRAPYDKFVTLQATRSAATDEALLARALPRLERGVVALRLDTDIEASFPPANLDYGQSGGELYVLARRVIIRSLFACAVVMPFYSSARAAALRNLLYRFVGPQGAPVEHVKNLPIFALGALPATVPAVSALIVEHAHALGSASWATLVRWLTAQQRGDATPLPRLDLVGCEQLPAVEPGWSLAADLGLEPLGTAAAFAHVRALLERRSRRPEPTGRQAWMTLDELRVTRVDIVVRSAVGIDASRAERALRAPAHRTTLVSAEHCICPFAELPARRALAEASWVQMKAPRPQRWHAVLLASVLPYWDASDWLTALGYTAGCAQLSVVDDRFMATADERAAPPPALADFMEQLLEAAESKERRTLLVPHRIEEATMQCRSA